MKRLLQTQHSDGALSPIRQRDHHDSTVTMIYGALVRRVRMIFLAALNQIDWLGDQSNRRRLSGERMHVPPAFREEDQAAINAMIRAAGLCQFVTATAAGPMATPLPMILDSEEGEYGTLYGHLAKANPQWKQPVIGDALAIFMGADAYVTPSWYVSKQEHGKVVPTWNYESVQAFGPAEFFEDADRLRNVVKRLTDRHEKERVNPWRVSDAPTAFIQGQLKGIVGVRMPIVRLAAKRKMSQNRSTEDRAGVARGLAESGCPIGRRVAALIPLTP
jgi:transcriptional regulator